MKKTKIITYLSAALIFGAIAANINSVSVQAYEVSGFYQYETYDTGVKITKYTGGEFAVSIPSKIGKTKVTAIGDRAFENNDLIESVTIPNTVTTIGHEAFKDCDSLKEITIPNSVTTIYSDRWNNTFGSCDNLTSVVIGDGLKAIEGGCFSECPKLQNVTIGKKVTAIGEEAFNNCDSLMSIDIPEAVKSIGNDCFNDCNNLQIVNLFNGLETIGYEAFQNCDSLIEITIPNSVTTINSDRWNNTFGSCDNLTSVVIGDGLQVIQASCFTECPKLQNVTIGKKVTAIGEEAFNNCDSLLSINIPGAVKSIGNDCFNDCNNLQIVNLFYGLQTIGYEAFQNCDSLMEITIPNSVTAIYSDRWNKTFGSCERLLKLQIPNSVSVIGDEIVADSKNVVIYGYANSAAMQYATNNKILFQELPSVPSDSFSFVDKEILLMAGKTVTLKYTITPENTTDAIIWKTSDANIATVDNIGVVTAKSKGSVSIIATTTSGKKGSVTIVVQEAPKTIFFKTSSNKLVVGQTYTQKAILDDGSRTDVSITYTSSDTTIATVDTKGKVTAKKVGNATITARIFNGLNTTYQVEVYNAPTSVKLTPKKLTLQVNNTYTLLATLPEGSYTSKITFKSSNSSIATVNSYGTIVAKKKGSVKITVTTHNGKKAISTVTIK